MILNQMLDIKQIRTQPKDVEKKLKSRDPNYNLKDILDLDEKLRALKVELEALQAERNQKSKEIGEKKRKREDASSLMQEVLKISEKTSQRSDEFSTLEKEFRDKLSCLPNLPSDEVKISLDPAENVCLKMWGEKKVFSFTPKNHLELNEKLHLFDFKRSAKTTGSGWPAYKGMGARFEWALLNYMIDIQISNGFEMILPPLLVRPEIMYGGGQLPKFQHQLFKIQDEDYNLYLIPTSEIAINGLFSDEIIDREKLPLKFMAYSPCFRREAGAAGSSERGLIRMHQFNKIEMFCFAHPDESETLFNQMVSCAEQVLEGLGLHYRRMLLVTGDTSFASAKTIDIEVWLPGQNRYYEVSSISNCTDFQARRSNIRFKHKEEKPAFVHTLNGSGLATSRLFVSLLENNQQEDGSVLIPTVLQKYLDHKSVFEP